MVNLRTFDLNLLRIFEAVVQDGSVSKAADKLGLSQPAVSNALNRLRRELDDPLFVRSHSGMVPTPKAERLAAAVLAGLTTIRSGLSAGAHFDPAVSARSFTLLMTDVGEIAFLPRIVPRLSREAPNVDIRVMEFGVERYEELLDSGVADLAVGRVKLSDALCSEEIHSSPFYVLADHRNRFIEWDEGAARISLESYLKAPHIFVLPRGASPDPVTKALGPRALERRIALSIPHATALPMLIPGTDLVAMVPEVCVKYLTASGDLCAAPAPFEIEANHVRQWWHRRSTKDPGHMWLRQVFASVGV